MPIYEHRQVGTVILVSMAVTILIVALFGALVPYDPTLVASIIGLVLLLTATTILFGSLTTRLTREELLVSFGPGWIRRRFRVEDIRAASHVTNRWYHGWGIHLTGSGWLFNVSGFEAVQLELNGGRRFRIGTDDPQGLVDAIRSVVPDSNG